MQLTQSLAERLLSNEEPWCVVDAQRRFAGRVANVDCCPLSRAWITAASAKHNEAHAVSPDCETNFQPTYL